MPETAVEQPAVPVVVDDDLKKEALVADEAEKKDVEKKEEDKKEEKKEDKKEKKCKEAAAAAAPPPPAVHKKDFEKDVVYLYQFARCPQLPSISPKCLKVETWLKLQGIKYENVEHNSKLRSKRGLLPFVELNGEEIADSELIIRQLAKQYGKDLDGSLSAEQRNVQHAMLTMVDNHLHGSFMHWASKSADNMLKGYKLDLQRMTGYKIPNALLNFAFKHTFCRKGMKKAKASGFNGYTPEEIEESGKHDLGVLKEMLADKDYFFGEQPHSLDLVAFSELSQILNVDGDVKCPLRDYIKEEAENLVGFYDRMKAAAWGDHWDEAAGEKMELNPHIPKPDPPKKEETKKAEDTKKAAEAEDTKKDESTKDKKEDEKEKGDSDEKEKEEEKKEDK